jgi:Capsule assembly protein Wzi
MPIERGWPRLCRVSACSATAMLLVSTAAGAGPSAEAQIARHRALSHRDSPRDAAPAAFALLLAARTPSSAVPRLLAPALALAGTADAGLRLSAARCLVGAPTPWIGAAPAGGGACASKLVISVSASGGDTSGNPDQHNMIDGLRRPRSSTLDGSMLTLALPVGELYASVQSRHWGPGWAGSLILDGAAAPLPAIGWRQLQPREFDSAGLKGLGRWSADIFIAALEGHAEPARPALVGMRLGLEPWPGVQLGLSRTMQWGGRGRPDNLASLLRALVGRDNADFVADRPAEPGNQLAGFDLRVTLPGRSPLALYVQGIGEDEAGLMPSKYVALAGVDIAWRAGAVQARAYVEWADLVAGVFSGQRYPGTTYRHHIYQQGYSHAGRPLGHPLGGDARLASLGLIADAGRWSGILAVHRGSTAAQAQLAAAGSRISGLDAALAWDLGAGARASLAVWSWRIGTAQRETSAQVAWRLTW